VKSAFAPAAAVAVLQVNVGVASTAVCPPSGLVKAACVAAGAGDTASANVHRIAGRA